MHPLPRSVATLSSPPLQYDFDAAILRQRGGNRMTLQVRDIDVGWSYHLDGPCQAILFGPSTRETAVPPGSLIQTRVKKRGSFGFMKAKGPAYHRYVDRVYRWVAKATSRHDLVVLPEFSFSRHLEKRVARLLSQQEKKCIVVGGSYYRRVDKVIESVCPVFCGSMAAVHQHKLFPSPHEERFLDEPATPTIHVFKNTGFGDLAVVLCSDALPARFDAQKSALRGRIDLLVVVARNSSPTIPSGLEAVSHEMQWTIVYCNGLRAEPSSVISPYRRRSAQRRSSTHRPKLSGQRAKIDLRRFYLDLATKSRALHRPTQPKRFRPAPRHWPYKRSGAIDFASHMKVVAIGSHFDDVWVGCAGSLMLLKEHYDAQVVCALVCSSYPYPYFGLYDLKDEGYVELKRDVENLCAALKFELIQFEGPFQDREFHGATVKLQIEMTNFASRYSDADLIFVPRQDDPHEDHVLTTRAALNAFRRADVLEYEIKDFRRAPFHPNTLVDLSRRSAWDLELRGERVFEAGGTFAERKVALLTHAFSITGDDPPQIFQPEHTLGRLSFRASQSGKGILYAEAFVAEVAI